MKDLLFPLLLLAAGIGGWFAAPSHDYWDAKLKLGRQ